ncbi:CPBP family intramembrane glutamic endopeptidase [Mastigocoleus testarum]|uniref:Abortive phage infection protein n=1 Tax=Mastigocoleus testarum BC008 TaxID=371196 RepID=A0A0V7ZC65_9CYAN|nr:CPBP family intramembrane glutamic endopeptidase [Mastigocoleus testarum]KST61910.1 abortive phage infection protein [Mastigocoleus testarum BC008]
MTNDQKPESEIPPYLTRTQVLAAIGATAIFLWIIAKLWLRFSNVYLMSWRWEENELFLGAVLGLIITIFSSLAYKFWNSYRLSADYYLDIVLKPLVLPDLIWVGLLPGLSEELLFRGVMLPALGFNHLAVIISSICFGVLHLNDSQQWSYVIWATVVGFVLGYSAIISGNLLVPIVAHITTNLLSSFIWKLLQYFEINHQK